MAKAIINSQIIGWAQDRSGISDEILAERFSKKEPRKWLARIKAWKGGEAPTFRQAQQLARNLRIPFGYLYASTQPQESSGIPDLRTLGDEQPRALSSAFMDLLLDIQAKQDWFKDELVEAGRKPLDFVGRFSIQSDPLEVAGDIRDELSIDDDLRTNSTSWQNFLSVCCDQAEKKGVLVFRSGVVGFNNSRPLAVDEFRGFALADEYAPVVFINSKDTIAAQTFTLMHELSHIWIGATGVSNARLGEVGTYVEAAEQMCNQVAAEVLVPRAEFRSVWNSDIDVDVAASAAARRFRVSTIVILRRALDLELINRSTFFEAYSAQLNLYKDREAKQGGGGNFANLMSARNSKRFTRTLLTATMEGRVPLRDAANLLNVRIKTVRDTAVSMGVV